MVRNEASPQPHREFNRLRRRFAVFVAVVQSILLGGHFFLYETWVSFWGTRGSRGAFELAIVLFLLSISFVSASVLGFRHSNFFIRVFYTVSAVWLGFLNFFFFACCFSWIVFALVSAFHLAWNMRVVTAVLFGVAVVAGIYAVINAAWVREISVTVKLPNLPESWRGRTAVVFSDSHLGHIRGYGFIRRLVARINRIRPDVVFIPGDFYDGVAADFNRLAMPLSNISARLGTWFIAGNHEEFTDHTRYFVALQKAGVRILNNEKVELEGLQLVGVHFRDAAPAQRFRGILHGAALDRNRPSILLAHVPSQLQIPEQEGISLQISGHTHHGQVIPYTWLTERIFGAYAYGLHLFGNMQVYTSCGVGSWGPPLRLGSHSELVILYFESQ